MKCVACTIVSKNYIAYAKTWAQSMRISNPDIDLFVLIVDKILGDDTFLHGEGYKIIGVQDIGIERFDSISFKYSILELNTNVKPSFLRFLINERGAKKVIYFDPDIYVYGSASWIYDLLDDHSFALTPHILSPIKDSCRPSEQDHLRTGIFNLGFIAVGSDVQSKEMLDWWAGRCLHLAYNDNRDGLFVDQKWLDLAPALFSRCKIIRDVGCNVAYWNLQERTIECASDGTFWVNGDTKLTFFHFSGLVSSNLTAISKHQDRVTLDSRPELRKMFSVYWSELRENGYERHIKMEYTFGVFNNGNKISDLARRMYSVSGFENDQSCNPFDENSGFYRRNIRRNVLFSQSLNIGLNSRTYSRKSMSVVIVNMCFVVARFLLGPDRFWQFCKYLSYISIVRNQN